MKSKIITSIIITAVLSSFPATAKEKKTYPFELRKYEVSVSAGLLSEIYNSDFAHYHGGYDISEIYRDYMHYDKVRYSATFSFNFTYNFSKIIAIQAMLSYQGGRAKHFIKSEYLSTSKANTLTPMAAMRVSWLNRKLIRLYSSFGIGADISFNKYSSSKQILYLYRNRSDVKFAFQLCPIGISIGGKIYGFAETGIGTLYMGGAVGIGYRF